MRGTLSASMNGSSHGAVMQFGEGDPIIPTVAHFQAVLLHRMNKSRTDNELPRLTTDDVMWEFKVGSRPK